MTGVKVRQGPLHFGTSAVFRTTPQPRVRELGLRLLESAGYKGFAQVEFAYDRRDGDYKLLEVNTRVADVGRGRDEHVTSTWPGSPTTTSAAKPEPEPVDLRQELWWAFFAKDLLGLAADGEAARADARRRGRAIPPAARRCAASFAADDPLPALGVPAYARSKMT